MGSIPKWRGQYSVGLQPAYATADDGPSIKLYFRDMLSQLVIHSRTRTGIAQEKLADKTCTFGGSYS